MKSSSEHVWGRNRIWYGFTISLAVHGLLLILHATLPSSDRNESEPVDKSPIELTQMPPQALPPSTVRQAQKPKPVRSKEMEIAQSEKADNNTLDPNAKFLSDKSQTAEKEMRAKSIDDFREKTGEGPKGKEKGQANPETGVPEAETAQNNLDVPDNGVTAIDAKKNKGVKRDWKTLSLKDLGVGDDLGQTSASDDRLRGVQDGDHTILSTREFRYFSYYNRIKELLRQYWKPSVERKLARIWERGKNVSDEEMVTQVLVLLSPEGRIAKISRVGSSGFNELDEAAVEAFQQAGPFPNPPKGIIDADGFVRIRWDFILRAEAAPRINFGSAGSGSRPLP